MNFFKRIFSDKSKQTNGIQTDNMDVFSDATINQKKSIANFFTLLSLCDEGRFDPKEIDYISSSVAHWGFTPYDFQSYFKNTGKSGMCNDLLTLSKVQKETLVISSLQLAECDKDINEKELNFIAEILIKIEINENEYGKIVDKYYSLKKRSSIENILGIKLN